MDCVNADLAKEESISSIFDYCERNEYRLDGLIHCAGVCPVQDISSIDDKDILSTYRVNVFSFIELCRNYFEYKYRSEDSRIIAISSITSDRAYKRQLLYSSSKAALNQIVLSLAQEGISKGVRVNAIQLGAVETNMFMSLNPNMQTIGRHYPLGVMKADEVAEVIAELLTPKYSEMTGSIIRIDSGFSAVH